MMPSLLFAAAWCGARAHACYAHYFMLMRVLFFINIFIYARKDMRVYAAHARYFHPS